jgi:4-hydroxy-3-methylbut-2-enyl diphosphate reductase
MTRRTRGTVLTPLRTEWLALRDRLQEPPVRTGRATARVTDGPALVAGVAGALTDEARPGDVVVASEVRRGPEVLPSHAAPMVAGALRRAGLRVHLGPVVTTDRVVDDPATRGRLAASGAVAVDTESGLLADPTAGPSWSARSSTPPTGDCGDPALRPAG